MKNLSKILLIIAATIVLALFGVGRISFNVDILQILPSELPNVKALRLYKENFNQQRDLILTLNQQDAKRLDAGVEELATALISNGLASKADWQMDLFDSPRAKAEIIAYLWANSPAETTSSLASRLAPTAIPARLAETIENLSSSELTGADAMFSQYDPYGLLAHPFIKSMAGLASQGDRYSSPDGTMRLIFISPPTPSNSYREDATWLKRVGDYITDWIAANPEHHGMTFGMTGESPYRSEVAALMEKDLLKSALQTGLFIAVLFWIIQRRLIRLFYLILSLALIFAATLATSALVFHDISIMSIGFAAILMGLAADYGVLASQYHASFGGDARSLRRRIGPSVSWAALTTAAVFLALNLSAFPGISQLGNMVAIGILFAAVITLWVFVPLLCSSNFSPGNRVITAMPAPWMLRHGWSATVICLGTAAALLVAFGFPKLDYHISQLPEAKLKPMQVIREIQHHIPAWREDNLPLLVTGANDTELNDALNRASATLAKMCDDGLLASATLPAALWPQPANQQASIATLSALAGRKDELVQAARDAGFSLKGVALTAEICENWAIFAARIRQGKTVFPLSHRALAVLGDFIARNGNARVLLGSIKPADYDAMKDRDFEDLAPLNQPGILLAAWQTLQSSIKPLMYQDLRRVVLPCSAVLLLMLLVIFRDRRDFFLAVIYLLVCGVLICAIMAAIGQVWTFQNMAALPVLLGTGIDYAIHVLLAMRRYDGDLHRLWIGTGKALVFCGLTTTVGFATLTAATDPGLASFGRITSIGILIALLSSLVFLPAWWQRAHPVASRNPATSAG